MGLRDHYLLKEIVNSAGSGITMSQLSKNIGISEKQIERILRANGYGSSWYKETRSRATVTKKCNNAILLMDKENLSAKEAAKEVGVQIKSLLESLHNFCINGVIPYPECKKCGKEHDYSYGQGEFCSQKCARSYSQSKITKDGIEKRSEGLRRGKAIEEEIYNEIRKISEEKGSGNLQYPLKLIIDLREINKLYPSKNQTEDFKEYTVGLRKSDGSPGPGMVGHSHPEEVRDKISLSLKKKWEEDLEWAESMRFSIREYAKNNVVSDETKEKLRSAALERVSSGTHVGWQKRNKNLYSYPEQSWKNFFDSLGLKEDVDYVHEYVVNKKSDLGIDDISNYFLDFLFISPSGQKIDVEIDGKQHSYPDRKRSDDIRDELLIKNGYIVHRITWININKSDDRRCRVDKQKEDLLKLLKENNIVS